MTILQRFDNELHLSAVSESGTTITLFTLLVPLLGFDNEEDNLVHVSNDSGKDKPNSNANFDLFLHVSIESICCFDKGRNSPILSFAAELLAKLLMDSSILSCNFVA